MMVMRVVYVMMVGLFCRWFSKMNRVSDELNQRYQEVGRVQKEMRLGVDKDLENLP